MLFVDVVGSTALGGRLDPEDFHELMNGPLRSFGAAVTAHDGRVVQFAGDGLFVVFGTESDYEQGAENGVPGLAVIAAADVVERQNGAVLVGQPFQVRVGLDTGTVIVDSSVKVPSWSAARSTSPPGWSSPRLSADCGSATTPTVTCAACSTSSTTASLVKGFDEPQRTYLVELG